MVTWGDAASGGDSLEVWDQLSDGVVDLSHTSSAFAARKADGSVVPGSKLCVCVCQTLAPDPPRFFVTFRNSIEHIGAQDVGQ